jgi:glycosyltransferase involved in cell wall biosynthesis
MSSPLVTVVIPTRNRRVILATTLASVRAQSVGDIEVVVVDEGSTDGTAEAVEALADPRIRVVRNPQPTGVAAARNRGMREGHGSWVALLDDDDLWGPAKLHAQLEAARVADAAWAYTGAVAVDDDLTVVRAYPPPTPEVLRADLPLRNTVPAGSSNVLVRRNLVEEAGMFDEGLRHLADWDLWIRLGRLAAPACAPGPHVAYRIHAGNASLDTPEILGEAALIEQRYGTPIDWTLVHAWIADSLLRSGRRRAAAGHFFRAGSRSSMRHYARALNALVSPAPAGRINHNPFRSAAPPDPWAVEAETWLGALRPTVPDPGS